MIGSLSAKRYKIHKFIFGCKDNILSWQYTSIKKADLTCMEKKPTIALSLLDTTSLDKTVAQQSFRFDLVTELFIKRPSHVSMMLTFIRKMAV